MATAIPRRDFLLAGLGALTPQSDYSFCVFGLLKPKQLNVYAEANSRLHARFATGDIVVEGARPLSLDRNSTPCSIAGADGAPVCFSLEIPGVIRRRYLGRLRVKYESGFPQPIVSMNLETAVGSIVGAELPSSAAPTAALAAQAIAARSFIFAARHPRHRLAQFCDTTHCQFLRSPAVRDSRVERATNVTKGLVLSELGCAVPAHYSAACGGRSGAGELDNYRYRSVECETCQRERVERRGHGFGLCQTGAIGLAREGWRWEEIVAKYYPGCVMRSVSAQSAGFGF